MVASLKAVHRILGVCSWFGVVSRPHYSCFRSVYSFVDRAPAETQLDVPEAVVGEFVLFVALAPLLAAGLDREWLPLLLASDAAPEYGFGTSVGPLSCRDIAALGRKSERRGDFVRLERPDGENEEPERFRLGRLHKLPIEKERLQRRPEHQGE